MRAPQRASPAAARQLAGSRALPLPLLQALSTIANVTSLRWWATTSCHSRVIHFE